MDTTKRGCIKYRKETSKSRSNFKLKYLYALSHLSKIDKNKMKMKSHQRDSLCGVFEQMGVEVDVHHGKNIENIMKNMVSVQMLSSYSVEL